MPGAQGIARVFLDSADPAEGGRHARIRDPEGNRVELYEELPLAPIRRIGHTTCTRNTMYVIRNTRHGVLLRQQ